MSRSFPNFVLSLIAAILILSSVVSCSQDPKTLEAKYQARGIEALKQNHANEAVIDFENLVKLDPKSGISHFLLAQAFQKKGWIVDAVSEDQTAISLDHHLPLAHLALAEYEYGTGQTARSLKETRIVLASDPENVHARVLLIRLTLFRQNSLQARKELHSILSTHPKSVSTTLALADLNLFEHRIDRSRDLFQSVASTLSPRNSGAWIGLGNCALAAGRIPEARIDFEKAHALAPSSITDTIVLGNFYVQQGQVQKAVALLDTLSKHHADARVPLKIGEYDLLLGKTARARRILLSLEQQKLDSPELHAALATADLQEHKEREAYAELSDALAQVPGNIRIRTIMARIIQTEGHPHQALALLQSAPTLPSFPPGYWILTARLEGQVGDLKKALKAVKTGLSQNPASRLLRIEEMEVDQALKRLNDGLAASDSFLLTYPGDRAGIEKKVFFLEQLKRFNDARSVLSEARKHEPNDSSLELTELELIGQTHNTTGMLRSAEDFLKANPKDILIRTWLAAYDSQNGHPNKARLLWKSIRIDDPGNIPAALSLSDEALSHHRYAESVDVLKAASKAHPEVEQLHLLLGESLEEDHHPNKASVELSSALRLLPTDTRAHWDLVNIDLSKNDLPAAKIHLDAILNAKGLSPAFHAQALGVEGLLEAQIGQPGEAIKDFSVAASLDPRNPTYPRRLGNILGSLDRNKAAIASYTRVLSLDPKEEKVRIERDWLEQIDSKRNTEQSLGPVVAEAHAYLEHHPKALFAQLILFEAALKENKPKEAERDLETLKKTAPDNPSVKVAEVTIEMRNGHFDQAKKILLEVLRKDPANLTALREMAALDQARNQFSDSKYWLEKILAETPEDTDSALSLATAENTLKEYGPAQILLERVLKHHPWLPEAELLLGQTESGMGELQQAHTLLSTLSDRFPENYLIRIQLGESEEKMGLAEQALDDYRKAVALDPKNPVGYNNLAYLLARMGKHLNQALRLAQKSRSILDSPDVDDTEGFVLYRMGHYQEAESSFEEAKNKHFHNPEFLVHMGMNEWKMNHLDQSRATLEEALRTGGLNPHEKQKVDAALKALKSTPSQHL
ncbi:MAG: tetratricopeptide repeat protein [Leptospirales bacterium]